MKLRSNRLNNKQIVTEKEMLQKDFQNKLTINDLTQNYSHNKIDQSNQKMEIQQEFHKEKNQPIQFYQVYMVFQAQQGCGSFQGFLSEQHYIKTRDKELAKQVFIFQLFGKRRIQLSKDYAQKAKKLMKQFDEKGQVQYDGQYDTYRIGNQDQITLVLETTQLCTQYSFTNSQLLIRKDELDQQGKKEYWGC